MELTEERIFSAFGLDPAYPQGTQSANNPDAADPEDQGEEQTDPAYPGTQGEREPEPAEAATESETDQEEDTEEETDEGEEGEEDDGTEDDADGAGAPGGLQTAEERRANAARRRQQETQAAVNAAVQQALQQQAQQFAAQQQAFFQQAQLTNPFTKQPITSMEEFQAWKQAQNDARIQQELKSGKLTVETLTQLVSEAVQQTPAVQQAQQLAAQQKAAAEAQERQQFQQGVEAQLAEIRKTDPSIQSVADLLNKPYSNEFYAAVKRGNNYLDAFYLATRSQAAAQAAASARQRAMNSMASKAHMKRTGINGKAGATITPEEEKMYRLFNPNATPEQIQAFQNKVKKG
jgi:hypothetical protein